MARVRIPSEDRVIEDEREIAELLASAGIQYERWIPSHPLADDASEEEVLAAYATEIEQLKQQGGYTTADVCDLSPSTPNLDTMLNKFNKEHWHDEDEVRFTLKGRGVFHIHPEGGPVLAVEVEGGDLLRVPQGTHHWFDLCSEKRIRVIRLFQDPSGWTPHYTESQVDSAYQPLCMGPQDIPPKPRFQSAVQSDIDSDAS